mmetsp:Transcript_36925/g.56551  ORF Transcript_36925/g.56551 Transcript_36925/m.56551 type:complete len:89 (-) Transcript_36925:2859-3125(-)
MFHSTFDKEQYMLNENNFLSTEANNDRPENGESEPGDMSSKSARIDTSKKKIEVFRATQQKETEMENYSDFFIFVKKLTHQLLSSDQK